MEPKTELKNIITQMSDEEVDLFILLAQDELSAAAERLRLRSSRQ